MKMKAVQFDIENDGDFYCDPLFTIAMHHDKKIIEKRIIENLRKIYETFRTTKGEYVMAIKDCIGRFLTAYDDKSLTEYHDEEQEEVWFEKINDEFVYCFELDNGNQFITIRELEVTINEMDGGYEILQTF